MRFFLDNDMPVSVGRMLRRRRNPIGRHVRLRCAEPEAAAVLEVRLSEVLAYLERDHAIGAM